MSYDYEGRNFTDDVPILSGADLKLDWADTGKFFTPIQDSERTLDALTSWFPTFDENQLDIEIETGMLKDTGIKSTGTRTLKEVENILYWRKKDERQAFDMSRTTAPGFAMTAQFASSIFNPVEVAVGAATVFVPGLGQAYLAARVAKKNTKLARMAEAAKIGAVQNTAIGVGFEPLNYAVETHYGHDYGLKESLINVAANTAFGGLFGSGVQRFTDRKGFARTHEQRIWDELPQTSKLEITDAVKIAMDNNVSLKTDDIIKIARTDRFFRYASKEGEGEGGFYDKVRVGFLEKVFKGNPELEARYHELNLQRITKGKESILGLEFKESFKPDVEEPLSKSELSLGSETFKKYKQALSKEIEQFRKVAELNEKYRVMTSKDRHSKEVKEAKTILTNEIGKLDNKSQWLLSVMQTDKPTLLRHKRILNEVIKTEHSNDNDKMISDMRTMTNRDPLQPDIKHETPETPVETFDATPENYEKLLLEDTTTTAPETDEAVKLRNKRLSDELKVIDAANDWIDKFNLRDCDG